MTNTVERSPTELPAQLDRLRGQSPVVWIWLLVIALLSAFWSVGVSPNADADDLLKLQKIRWLLEGGAWFDQSVPGILQPEPFYSHWPRLLDLPYAVTTWAIEPFVGRDAGVRAAIFFVPLLLLLPVLALYRAIVGALGFERPNAAFVLALVPSIRAFFEFSPGRIDYHNVQILFLFAAIALTLSRSGRAALANGALVAFALATSVEFALFFALVMAIYAFEFIGAGDGSRRRLALFGTGLAAAAVLAYPISVAPANYGAVACDMYSAPHLLALLFAGFAFMGAAAIGTAAPLFARALLVAVPSAAGLASLALLFPQCLAGPYGDVSNYLREAWLLQILQERSLFHRPDFVYSGSMLGATILFVGAIAPAVIAVRDRLRDRNLVVFALFALLALAQAVLYFRNMRYLPLFAGPGVVLVIAALIPALRVHGAMLANRFGNAALAPAAMLTPGLLVSAGVLAITTALPQPAGMPAAAQFAGSCNLESLAAFQWPGAARVMAPPDVGIRLLPNIAPASVVAVPFHTGTVGIQRAYRFLDTATEDPRAILDESQATHVAICAWRDEASPELEKLYPFGALLMEGKEPPWLDECPTDAATPIRIYRYPAAGPAADACPIGPDEN